MSKVTPKRGASTQASPMRKSIHGDTVLPSIHGRVKSSISSLISKVKSLLPATPDSRSPSAMQIAE